MYVAISGNLGSGKTTIARGLSATFNCALYPRRSYNATYIQDLLREPERWTTEAQISFMVHKHDEIREALARGRFFVLDRTFEEDVQVFAERFHDDGTIDSRGIELIRQLASDLRRRIESPSLIVFCDCPVSVCEARLALRPREYQRSYPPAHLAMLQSRLDMWLSSLGDIPVIHVSTNTLDFRLREHTDALARRIDAALTTRANQPELFPNEVFLPTTAGPRTLTRRRQIYLAAPFTGKSSKVQRTSSLPSLFLDNEYTETVPTTYRRQLNDLARAIESHGHDVLLPHRDINRWGRRALPASEIARRCLDAVASSDYFVGMIGESFGCHAELAYALGLGKPALVLVNETEPSSFFGIGMTALGQVAQLRAGTTASLIRLLRGTDPLTLMKRVGDLDAR